MDQPLVNSDLATSIYPTSVEKMYLP